MDVYPDGHCGVILGRGAVKRVLSELSHSLEQILYLKYCTTQNVLLYRLLILCVRHLMIEISVLLITFINMSIILSCIKGELQIAHKV